MNYRMLAVGNSTYASAEKVAVITKFESAKIKKEIAGLRASDINSGKLAKKAALRLNKRLLTAIKRWKQSLKQNERLLV